MPSYADAKAAARTVVIRTNIVSVTPPGGAQAVPVTHYRAEWSAGSLEVNEQQKDELVKLGATQR
jgi:hypothetical protein